MTTITTADDDGDDDWDKDTLNIAGGLTTKSSHQRIPSVQLGKGAFNFAL